MIKQIDMEEEIELLKDIVDDYKEFSIIKNKNKSEQKYFTQNEYEKFLESIKNYQTRYQDE